MLGVRARFIVAMVLASSAAVGAGTAFAAGCTAFTADAGAAGTTDAAPADGQSDAMAPTDASGDGAAEIDAGAACADSDAMFVGGADLNLVGRSADFIPTQVRDAHFYVATHSGTARCVWLYVVTPPSAGNVYFGIYSDKSGGPYLLLGRAKLTSPIVTGWNHAPLAAPLAITSGTAMWLAVGPDQSDMEVNSVLSSGCNPRIFSEMLSAKETLSNQFTSATRFDTCSLAAYLGP